jgi:tRNA (guanine-N7-)-methyltransferase
MPAGSPVESVESRELAVDIAFPEAHPLVLDLGCGNGLFLAALAALRPDRNVLGIEKKAYRVRQATRRVAGLPNARVVHAAAVEVLAALPPRSVASVYLLFNDPWPKRRHAERRLVQIDFVRLLDNCLQPDGVFYFATDSWPYAAWAEEAFRTSAWRTEHWSVPSGWPETEFEQRFASAGVRIHRFQAIR